MNTEWAQIGSAHFFRSWPTYKLNYSRGKRDNAVHCLAVLIYRFFSLRGGGPDYQQKGGRDLQGLSLVIRSFLFGVEGKNGEDLINAGDKLPPAEVGGLPYASGDGYTSLRRRSRGSSRSVFFQIVLAVYPDPSEAAAVICEHEGPAGAEYFRQELEKVLGEPVVIEAVHAPCVAGQIPWQRRDWMGAEPLEDESEEGGKSKKNVKKTLAEQVAALRADLSDNWSPLDPAITQSYFESGAKMTAAIPRMLVVTKALVFHRLGGPDPDAPGNMVNPDLHVSYCLSFVIAFLRLLNRPQLSPFFFQLLACSLPTPRFTW